MYIDKIKLFNGVEYNIKDASATHLPVSINSETLADGQVLKYDADNDVWYNAEGGSQSVIYSETEREIGVWIDGKPLYQKTIVVNNATILVNGGYNYDISSLNVDTLIGTPVGFITLSNELDLRTLPFGLLGSYAVEMYATRSAVNLARKGADLTCDRIVFTIQYTKTTDLISQEA